MCAKQFPGFSYIPRGQVGAIKFSNSGVINSKGVSSLSLYHLNVFWKGRAKRVYVDVYHKYFSDLLSVSEALCQP